MKKIIYLMFSFAFTLLFVVNVNATTVVVDPNNNIKLPYNLFVDTDNYITFNNLDAATKFYQIVDVSDNEEITKYINNNILDKQRNLYDAEQEFSKYELGTNEYKNASDSINLVKSNIDDANKSENLKTLISDYDDNNWITLTGNIIPMTNVSANKYYIIWIKTDDGTTKTYDYAAYKAINSNYFGNTTATKTDVTNPDTGIEHTILFLTVGALVVIGSSLVVSKNKESY